MAQTDETVEAQQSAAADIAPPSQLLESDNDNDSSSADDEQQQQQPDTKERRRVTIDIGAIQVNERANMLYTRCYRGRSTHLQRQGIRERDEAERARRRESEESRSIANNNNGVNNEDGINNEDGETDQPSTADGDRRRRSSTASQIAAVVRRRSSTPQMVLNYFGRASVVRGADNSSSLVPVTAIVVEEADAVVATELGFCERNWKNIAVVMTTLLVILAILLSIVSFASRKEENLPQYQEPPTASPTFDSKPTLSTVQGRGFIRCGLNNEVMMLGSFHLDLCRAVASVVIGDADSYEIIPTTLGTRWEILNNRGADLLIGGDTYTIEREVWLASAGSGFTFSAPYAYDGMTYAGNETFIECAEKMERYGICSSLSICVFADSGYSEYLSSNFPNGFYTLASSTDEMLLMMDNGTCNISAGSAVAIPILSNYSIGNKLFTKEPQAIVTRNTDREFSDVVNWVLQALFYGEEQGLTKNATLCSTTKNVTALAELNYLNAVYCVGSYNDLYYDSGFRGMNRINNGTNMHYPIPFGDLDYAFDVQESDKFGPRSGSTFSDIIIDTKLNCGVIVQSGNDTESLAIDGLSEDYCRTMSAALFYGNYKAVNLQNFSSSDEAFLALQDGTIDVLTGTTVEKSRDFGGYAFSTPYYYKSGTAKEALIAFAIATREDDSLFSSFVNCVVLAILYAEESGVNNNKVPFASIFGSEMRWSLRDAVSYSESYDKLFAKHFGIDSVRGRNGLNRIFEAGPQLHSLPSIT